MTRLALLAATATALFSLAMPGHATPITYEASLSGAAEAPPNASPATGSATVVYDSILHTLSISADWADLIGTTTVAHIHCCTTLPNEPVAAGVAVTPGTLPGLVIDAVLLPPAEEAAAPQTIVDVAVADGRFGTRSSGSGRGVGPVRVQQD